MAKVFIFDIGRGGMCLAKVSCTKTRRKMITEDAGSADTESQKKEGTLNLIASQANRAATIIRSKSARFIDLSGEVENVSSISTI